MLDAVTAVDADATTVQEVADNAAAAVDITTDNAQAVLDAVTDVDPDATTVQEVADNAAADVDITTDNAQAVLDAVTAVDASATSVQDVADNAAADVDITTDNAQALLDAITAVDADATTVQEVADNAATDALTDADGNTYADVDAAIVSNDDEATDANVADATDFDTLADLVTAYDALANPEAETFTLTTDADTIIGQGAGDAITGTDATLNSTDIIIDAVEGDGDSLTITATDDIDNTNAATVVGVENVNYTIQAFVAGVDNTFDVDSSGVTADNINLDVDQNGTSIVSATITGVATGTTVTASDDFTTAVTVDGDDDASVTISTAASAVTATSTDGEMAGVTASTSATGIVNIDVDDTDGTVVLTASAADDLNIFAVDATSVTATSAGAINAAGTALTVATTVNLTAADEILADMTAATSATLSAGDQDSTQVTESVITGAALTSLDLSGNGSAPTFNTQSAGNVDSITISGDQDVTVNMRLSDVANLTTAGNDLTVTDASTGTSTIAFVAGFGTADLTDVAADVINLGIDNDFETLTFASGAALTVSVTQDDFIGGSTLDGADASAATNTLAVALNDGDDTNGTGVNLSGVTLTDLASVSIDASVDDGGSTITSLTGSADNTDVTIEAGANGLTLATAVDLGTGDLVINSTGAVAGGATAITANSLTATESGAVTLNAIDATELATVTTGSGNDALTITNTGASLTLDAGAGSNTVAFAADTTANMTYTVTGGTGFDTLALADDDAAGAGVYSAGTMNLSGIDRISIVDGTSTGGALVTVANSLLDGQSYIMNNDDGGVVAITVELGSGEVSTDLSSLTFDNTFDATVDSFVVTQGGSTANLTLTGGDMINTFTTGTGDDVLTGGDAADVFDAGAGDNIVDGGDGADAITTAGGDDTIDGGAGADTIDAGAGDDSITGGEGVDEITIGTGADTVDLTEDTSVIDTVFIETVLDGSADGVGAGTFTDFNTVIGFEAGVDVVSFDIAVFDGNVTNVAGSDASVALNDLDASNYTNVDQVVNFISDIEGVLYTANDGVLDVLTVTLGTDLTAMYAIDDDDGAVDATEINLIGTVDTAILGGEVTIA